MLSGPTSEIIYPSIARGWGSSASVLCCGALCAKKQNEHRNKVYKVGQECEESYTHSLRQLCELPTRSN